MVTFALMPAFAYAQLNRTWGFIEMGGKLISRLITIAAGLALLAFFWGLAMFIFRVGGDEKAVDKGKVLMKWGLIALFVLVSVWGIIRFFQGELLTGIDMSNPLTPGLKGI